MPPVPVEIATGSSPSRGRPPGQAWLIRLRRGNRTAITTIGLSRTSGEHLPQKITDLLAEPDALDRIKEHRSGRESGKTQYNCWSPYGTALYLVPVKA